MTSSWSFLSTQTLVFASLSRRQQVQVLSPLRPSRGNASNRHNNTVTSTTPVLNGSVYGLPERIWTLSIVLSLHTITTGLVSENRSLSWCRLSNTSPFSLFRTETDPVSEAIRFSEEWMIEKIEEQ